jgi:hypothetical protein
MDDDGRYLPARSCRKCGGSGCAGRCCTGTITRAGRVCKLPSDTECIVPASHRCGAAATAVLSSSPPPPPSTAPAARQLLQARVWPVPTCKEDGGDPISVLSAPSPLGPWTSHGSVYNFSSTSWHKVASNAGVCSLGFCCCAGTVEDVTGCAAQCRPSCPTARPSSCSAPTQPSGWGCCAPRRGGGPSSTGSRALWSQSPTKIHSCACDIDCSRHGR